MVMKQEEAISALRKCFKKKKLVQLKDLAIMLSTQSRMSIFRRLRKLHYLSSYTHRGAYYTLPEVIQFDSNGLWIYQGVGFSQHGNLKQTVTHLIECSVAGMTQKELQQNLKIRVHNTLLDLYRNHSIGRNKIGGTNIYLSINASRSKKQLSRRNEGLALLKPANWLIIEVLVAIIQCNKIEINPEEISEALKHKNYGITLAQINNVIEELNLKKTPDI